MSTSWNGNSSSNIPGYDKDGLPDNSAGDSTGATPYNADIPNDLNEGADSALSYGTGTYGEGSTFGANPSYGAESSYSAGQSYGAAASYGNNDFSQPSYGQQVPQYDQGQYGQTGYPQPYGPQPGYAYGAVQPYAGQPYVPAGYQQRNKIVAAVLFFFLGEFGVGNFYLGQTKLGVIKLVLSIIGMITALILIGFLILGGLWIWKIVEMVMVLTGAGGYDRDANGVPLQ